jgi:hypothetical protein
MIFLNVSYDDRIDAKRLGARFDGNTKKWFAPTGRESELINKYGDEQAKKQAEVAISDLARSMAPHSKNVSDGFRQGHYTYPCYAFRKTSEDADA